MINFTQYIISAGGYHQNHDGCHLGEVNCYYLTPISFDVLQYVHYLQRKYSLGSFNLLGHTAPAQAASLLLLGPFVDYWLTNKRVDAYNYGLASVVSFASYLF